MKLLAIDTATEQCSAAILTAGTVFSRVVPTARGHADLILPMVDELLKESHCTLNDFDVLAFGRGPGSFTGVRIAVGVIQGLALSRSKLVVGVSNLAAVAQQATDTRRLPSGANILVCMDARMNEVYWARYRVSETGLVSLIGEERVSPPANVNVTLNVDDAPLACGVGTGWRAYRELRERFSSLPVDDGTLPSAIDIARLAVAEFQSGRATTAALAQPVYLRDQVVAVRS